MRFQFQSPALLLAAIIILAFGATTATILAAAGQPAADAAIVSRAGALPLIREGKLKAFGVASETRIPELPDVPAIAEFFPGFYSIGWYAVVAPPKTPAAIADKASQAIAETLKRPDVAKRFSDLAIRPVGMAPADMAVFLREETERWRKVIASARIKPE